MIPGSGPLADGPIAASPRNTVSSVVSIAVNSATHGHSATSPSLTGHSPVAVNGATHAHAATSPAITGHSPVAVEGATHAHTAGSPALVVDVAVDGATHAHSASQPSITGHSPVDVDDTLHAHSATSPDVDSSSVVDVDDAAHAHSATSPTITGHSPVSVNNAAHAHIATSPSLTGHSPVAVNNANHAHVAGSPTITGHSPVTVQSASHAHTATSPLVFFPISVASALHSHSASLVPIWTPPAALPDGLAFVIEIDALDSVSESRVTLRFAASDDDRITGLGDERWWPGVVGLPTLAMEAWDGNFTGSAQIAAASIGIDPVALAKNDASAPSYRWPAAPLRIHAGNANDAWADWRMIFAGIVEDYGTDEAGRYSFTAKVDSEPFEADLLATKYAGTGGAEGGEDLKEKPKPMCFGYALNVEPVLIDTVNNVFQVHGYGAIEDVVAVYERAADFGASSGDYASYAALIAAAIPEGEWGTCLAQGMFRLGAPPFGLITADVQGDNAAGWVRTTADIISRMASIAGISSARLDLASLAALNIAVPYPINLYITTSITFLELAQTLARPCNAQALISWTGKLQICRFGSMGTSAFTLDAQGEERPPVLDVEELRLSAPYSRIEMQGARCWRVHSKDEVALEDEAYEAIVEAYIRSPTQPATPTGAGIPSGWSEYPPGYISEPFGPVWRSVSNQKRYLGTVPTPDELVGTWSEPVITDSRYKGWTLALSDTQPKMQAATDAIKVAADFDPDVDNWATFYIPEPMIGPCRLKCRVTGAGDSVGIGFVHFDPSVGGIDMFDVNTGFWVPHGEGYFTIGSGLTDIYPFTNYDIDGQYIDDSFNGLDMTPLANCDFEMIYNGELIELYVNGDKVRSYFFNPTWDNLTRWPAFQLLSPGAEITNIVWERATQGNVLEFPYDEQFGAMRRMDTEVGWELNAPNMTTGFGSGWIYSRNFKGGGRLEATVGPVGGASGLSILQLGSKATVVISWDGDQYYEAYANGGTGSPIATGVWAAGDTFALQYSGKRTRIYKNGSRIVKKKVGSGATVQAYIEFGATHSMYNIKLEPFDEEEFQTKGSVSDTSLTTPITDASPTVTGGYIVVAETGSLVVQPPDDDDLVVSALLSYTYTAGTAATFTPDTKIQYSTNGGSSWSDFSTTQTPTTAPGATAGGATEQVSLAGTMSVTATATYLFRLVTKNTVAGTFSVTLTGFLSAEWQG